eukprot:s2066_g1.t1
MQDYARHTPGTGSLGSVMLLAMQSRWRPELTRELCGEGARSPDVVLDVRSGWVAAGAKVELENVKAGYADIPRDVLKGINLVFQPKTKVGIVGTTGSSLLLVLLRILEPRAGRVLINNVDTQKLGLMTLRGALGLVPQDPILFTGSLRHNLDPLEYYTDGRIWEALRCAHLDGLVRSFVGGLDYQVSDEGSNLSFGQRQLFCLARMVLRQPSLLLLDEATSAIDPRTQENVQETISHAFPDSTLVAIAHRLETVLEFDQVVVLDSGEVEEQGTPKELQQLQDLIKALDVEAHTYTTGSFSYGPRRWPVSEDARGKEGVVNSSADQGSPASAGRTAVQNVVQRQPDTFDLTCPCPMSVLAPSGSEEADKKVLGLCKLYVLRTVLGFQDRGTGRASVNAAARDKRLQVHNEAGEVLLYDRPALPPESYRLQGDDAVKSIVAGP